VLYANGSFRPFEAALSTVVKGTFFCCQGARIPYLKRTLRHARIDAPCALHHIIIRGIERKAIFDDVQNREEFLERLSSLL